MRSVSLSNDGVTCTVSDNGGDLTIDTYATLIKQALVGVGFHPENVDDMFTDTDRWTREEDPTKHCTCRSDDEEQCFFCRDLNDRA